jgi:hemerythrin superfamily protein
MSTDAIVLLKEDHKEIRRLFRALQSASTRSRRNAAAKRVVKALTTTAFLEDECLHPVLRERLPAVEDDVLRSYEENHVAGVLCAELAAMAPDDERFDAKVTVLFEAVSRHFDHEEQGWFREVRDGMGRKELQEIGARMIKMRRKAPRTPAQPPAAPAPAPAKDKDKDKDKRKPATAKQDEAQQGEAKRKPGTAKQSTAKQVTAKQDKAKRKPSAAKQDEAKQDGVEQDVVDLLLHQHMQIRDLFLEVESATGDAREDAFHRLVRLLAVHETAEEQVVHPLTRLRVEGGDDIVGDRLAEEHAAKETLAELEKMGPAADEFPQLLEQLRLDVLDHAAKEEAYEFRYLRRAVPAGELRTMAALVQTAEAVAPTHPHPGVESATANTVAGPALSLFDRTKDLVRDTLTTSK